MATANCIIYCPASNSVASGAFVAPNNVTARDDVDPVFRVGGKFFDTEAGKVYMYVKFDNGAGNVAAANNNIAYVHTLAGWDPSADATQVTSDQSDSLGGGAATTSIVAGVFRNVITDGRYGFIQIGGRGVVTAAATVVAGDSLVSSATDGTGGEYAGTEIAVPFAVALDAAA